jgi:hypothetical protein
MRRPSQELSETLDRGPDDRRLIAEDRDIPGVFQYLSSPRVDRLQTQFTDQLDPQFVDLLADRFETKLWRLIARNLANPIRTKLSTRISTPTKRTATHG